MSYTVETLRKHFVRSESSETRAIEQSEDYTDSHYD